MVRDEEKYKQAVEFRKRGFTYSEIAKICDISVSTASAWLSKKRFSKQVAKDNALKASRDNKKRMMLLNKSRKAERTILYAETVRSADTEYRHYKSNPLFIAGLMLYKCLGDHKDTRVIRIANTDYDVHSIFIIFAKEFLGVEDTRIKFWLLLYPDLSERKCVATWSKKLKLKKEQFYKNQVIEGRSKKRTLHHGVGNTIIGSTVLKRKLNRWIELATKELQ